MKTALCQFDIVWEDKQANKEKIEHMIQTSRNNNEADWIIFPEMTLSGFSMNKEKTTLTNDDIDFFANIAERNSCWLSFGGVEDGYNNLITLNRRGGVVSRYSKIHSYSFGGEHKEYKAGDRQQTFNMEGITVVPAVCFDLRFPYLFWDMAEQTDVYVVIANWPSQRTEHWTTLLKARAIENQCYVIGVNRTGSDTNNVNPDSGFEYSGNSAIFNPMGKCVLDCKSNDGIFTTDIRINREAVEKTRKRFPFLNDRVKR